HDCRSAIGRLPDHFTPALRRDRNDRRLFRCARAGAGNLGDDRGGMDAEERESGRRRLEGRLDRIADGTNLFCGGLLTGWDVSVVELWQRTGKRELAGSPEFQPSAALGSPIDRCCSRSVNFPKAYASPNVGVASQNQLFYDET